MLSIPDMAIIGAMALIIFGPDQLPKVARKAGLFMRDVQNTSQSFIREMERAADEHETKGADEVARAHLLDPPMPSYEPMASYEPMPTYEPPAPEPDSVHEPQLPFREEAASTPHQPPP
jgi:sec-independent protein translocase protein TatA